MESVRACRQEVAVADGLSIAGVLLQKCLPTKAACRHLLAFEHGEVFEEVHILLVFADHRNGHIRCCSAPLCDQHFGKPAILVRLYLKHKRRAGGFIEQFVRADVAHQVVRGNLVASA
eukprot:CAMPEP_0119362806 /NCGR_PEP_ID=MMETSP1334-20130426/9745_1 /TAXON_ID=127549 /ORGANISM="Calcidiscus leptoporus, Strain RCC1130" /LENGTH=117 /DNA_ID=CAMNT_0007378061 /DNA_START=155 /DNA_END=508 /DNA_ORIENTATION=-